MESLPTALGCSTPDCACRERLNCQFGAVWSAEGVFLSLSLLGLGCKSRELVRLRDWSESGRLCISPSQQDKGLVKDVG
jgi:hypothetical protein